MLESSLGPLAMNNDKTQQSRSQPNKANPKQQARGVESQRKLLTAANDVFWNNGFSASTIAQIVETSGLSVGSFYHQFADKSELLQVAISHVLEDFERTLSKLDMSCEVNRDLFTVMYRISVAGRKLIARNRGIYRALAELTQTDAGKYGALQTITPTTASRVMGAIDTYGSASAVASTRAQVEQAVQLISMCVLQTELGMGPLFPAGREAFGKMLASAACGILGCAIPADGKPYRKS